MNPLWGRDVKVWLQVWSTDWQHQYRWKSVRNAEARVPTQISESEHEF